MGGSLSGDRPADSRPVLSRTDAREVYDNFARKGHHTAGKDAGGGYGGPAVTALLSMAAFEEAGRVVDYGCGQGKLGELVLSKCEHVQWHGLDQSAEQLAGYRQRMSNFGGRASCGLVPDGDPSSAFSSIEAGSIDRVVSTYVLDLLSEEDMFAVLDAAERCLDKDRGLLLLAGITWGYRRSCLTCITTAIWELLYRVARRVVGGCRPQQLEPYLLQRGWRIIESQVTLPQGFPWMASEVVAARPPGPSRNVVGASSSSPVGSKKGA